MSNLTWQGWILAAGLACAGVASAEEAPTSRFAIYQRLAYRHQPDLARQGLAAIAGSDALVRPGEAPTEAMDARLHELLQPLRNSSALYVLEVEPWPLGRAARTTIDASIARYQQLAQAVHRVAPALRIGYRGLLPAPLPPSVDPERVANPNGVRADEKRLAPIAQAIDALFPTLYTYADDERRWESAARILLREARRYGRPVYAYLSPELLDDGGRPSGHAVAGPRWRAQLELVRQLADGVVLTGGAGREWDDAAAWWVQTQGFIDAQR
jgi:hypothetical protein